MDRQKIKKQIDEICQVADKKFDEATRSIFDGLLNLVEYLITENEKNTKLIQEQRDEINRLKGEQGKPKIRPQSTNDDNNHSSEEDRKKRRKKKKKKSRRKKKDTVKVDRTVFCPIDKSQLPPDAERKGYKPLVIQDIKITTDNIQFQREVYYSKALKKTYVANLPEGYDGEYGPGIRALVLSLYHDSNMTEPAIVNFFHSYSVVISNATVSRMLTDKHEIFHQEKENLIDAALQAPYQHMDDTSGRVNGKNHYVHILSGPFFTAYFTRPKKDRLTLLEILCRGELKFLLNQASFQLMEAMGLPKKRLLQLKKLEVSGELSRTELDAILVQLFPNPKKHSSNRRYIVEACALTYYRTLKHALRHLMCDDAPQFNLIAEHKSLCWIHEGRHYKKMRPSVAWNRVRLDEFLEKFWDFYQKLLDYTKNPTDEMRIKLKDEFDVLFSTKTGYQALDDRIALTFAKMEALLLPLTFPFLPLHNNDAEGGAQHQARLRDIHLQTRNEKGTTAKDTFTTLVKTARKLGVNVFDYFHDRIFKTFSMPSLADLILEKIKLQPNTS